MASVYLFLFAFWIYFQGVVGCPFNCDCYQFKSVCRIVFDIDELDLDTDLLVVEGVLRSRHYLQLAEKPRLKKELHGCSCRTLQNCDDTFFTQSQGGFPVGPVRTPPAPTPSQEPVTQSPVPTLPEEKSRTHVEFSAGLDGIHMEMTTEYRMTTDGTTALKKSKWVDDFLKYLLASLIVTVLFMIFYCGWKVFLHRWRVSRARNAQKRYAASGYGSGETDDLPPPPPPELDGVSITSSETSQMYTSASSEVPRVVITTTAGPGPATATTSSTGTVTTPVPAPSSAPGTSSSAMGRAAEVFRRAAGAVGYPAGIPVDPSATGVGIRHDRPVPQAADQRNPDKRLRPRRKQSKDAPPVPPKPASAGRPRSPARPPSTRLAQPRRSARLRKKNP